MPENTQKGGLQVAVTTLRGTYPIEGAEITVFKGEYGSGESIATAVTDISGRSGLIELDAKPKELSETQGNAKPYNEYNLYIRAAGYLGQFNMGIPVFSGVTSIQNVDLIPQAAEGKQSSPRVINEDSDYNL